MSGAFATIGCPWWYNNAPGGADAGLPTPGWGYAPGDRVDKALPGVRIGLRNAAPEAGSGWPWSVPKVTGLAK